jgi:hypothetical protein
VSRDAQRIDWVRAALNLGNARMGLAAFTIADAPLSDAVARYREAIRVLADADANVPLWAALHANLGQALLQLGERTGERRVVLAAIDALRESFRVRKQGNAPGAWADALVEFAHARAVLANHEESGTWLEAAELDAERAHAVSERLADDHMRAHVGTVLASILVQSGQRESSTMRLERGVKLLERAWSALAGPRRAERGRAFFTRWPGRRRPWARGRAMRSRVCDPRTICRCCRRLKPTWRACSRSTCAIGSPSCGLRPAVPWATSTSGEPGSRATRTACGRRRIYAAALAVFHQCSAVYDANLTQTFLARAQRGLDNSQPENENPTR